MKKIFRNPFITNFFIFGTISFFTLTYLLFSVFFKFTLLGWSDYAINIFNNIIEGVFSSGLLLLGVEYIIYSRDKKKFGFLAGTYRKIYITGVNDERKRTESISSDEKTSKSIGSNIKFIEDSIYHELLFFDLENNNYWTILNYDYDGKYTGTVEYIDHDFIDKKSVNGHSVMNPKPKCKAHVQLIFTSANAGTGNYKYENKYDFGIYNFQIDPENKKRILVYYQNTIPSGISEGYQIWEKV